MGTTDTHTVFGYRYGCSGGTGKSLLEGATVMAFMGVGIEAFECDGRRDHTKKPGTDRSDLFGFVVGTKRQCNGGHYRGYCAKPKISA